MGYYFCLSIFSTRSNREGLPGGSDGNRENAKREKETETICMKMNTCVQMYLCIYTHIYSPQLYAYFQEQFCITNSNFAFAAILRNLRYMTKIFISRFI